MFRKMPVVLLIVIASIVLLDSVLPVAIKEYLYSISLSIKGVIVLILPFVIFSLLFKAAVMLSKNATAIIATLLVLVLCSNFTSTFLSHFVGSSIYHLHLSLLSPQSTHELKPLWQWHYPILISNSKAMFAGIILGIITEKLRPTQAELIAKFLDKWINSLMSFIVYLVPVFVAGFVVKLQYDGVMHLIIHDYLGIFAVIFFAQFSYILMVYFVLARCNVANFINSLKNMLPAAISGFCTMSSAASMPLTLIGAERNTQNKDLAKSVIPATVNIHLIGDCFAIPIFAYAILKSFGIPEPSLIQYLFFTCYFVMAKFSVAAIPGGGILVMLPVLETYLGFNAEMLSFITALYILFDPIITSANVLGNGAFVKFVDQCDEKLNAKKQKELVITDR